MFTTKEKCDIICIVVIKEVRGYMKNQNQQGGCLPRNEKTWNIPYILTVTANLKIRQEVIA